MDKEVVVYIYMYTHTHTMVLKRNKSVLVRWINLEPVIQSEIKSERENKHHLLTHMCRI